MKKRCSIISGVTAAVLLAQGFVGGGTAAFAQDLAKPVVDSNLRSESTATGQVVFIDEKLTAEDRDLLKKHTERAVAEENDDTDTGASGGSGTGASGGSDAATPKDATASTSDKNSEPEPVVPNPLAPQKEDPADYGVPAAANRFKGEDGKYTIPRPTPGGEGAGVIPAGLEEFYNQKIEWGSCEGFALEADKYVADKNKCAYVIAPLDYSNPGGKTIALAVLKSVDPKQKDRIGSLFMNPGGPGSSGISLAAGRSRASTPVSERFDIVGWDPRGVASSLPMIRCESNAAKDAQRAGSDELTGEQQTQVLQNKTEDCYKNTGTIFGISGEEFIKNSGTDSTIKDLDMLRSVLGDEKLSYNGISYGTTIGYNYMMQFPNNIRALVLDAVTNPFENNPGAAEPFKQYLKNVPTSGPNDQIAGFQATFEQFLEKCAKTRGFGNRKGCAVGDVADKDAQMQRYYEIIRPAWGAKKYKTRSGRVVSFNDAVQGVILSMYSESFWKHLNTALHEMASGDTANLMLLLSDIYYSRGNDGSYELSDPAFRTLWCTDAGVEKGTENRTDEEKRKASLETFRVAPFIDPGLDENGNQRGIEPSADWCTFYKVQYTKAPGKPLVNVPNVLFIAGSFDSATPYHNGVVAAAATGSTLLSVGTNDHGSFAFGADDCVATIARGYLFDPSKPVPTDVTGETGVRAKDIYSNVIENGNQCQVTTFADHKITAEELLAMLNNPTVTLDRDAVQPGEDVTVSVAGLLAYENTTFELEGKELGQVRTDSKGEATLTFKAPQVNAESKLVLKAQQAGQTAGSTVLTVAPAAPAPTPVPAPAPAPGDGQQQKKDKQSKSLSNTGAQASIAPFAALLLLVPGVALLLAANRRRANS